MFAEKSSPTTELAVGQFHDSRRRHPAISKRHRPQTLPHSPNEDRAGLAGPRRLRVCDTTGLEHVFRRATGAFAFYK